MPLFEDDDFFLDEDELDSENQLTVIEKAEDDILSHLEELVKNLKTNLKFKEITDFDNNLRTVIREVDILIKLATADKEGLSDEEQLDIIKEAQKISTELTFDNIDDFVEKDEEEGTEPDTDFDIGDGTDF